MWNVVPTFSLLVSRTVTFNSLRTTKLQKSQIVFDVQPLNPLKWRGKPCLQHVLWLSLFASESEDWGSTCAKRFLIWRHILSKACRYIEFFVCNVYPGAKFQKCCQGNKRFLITYRRRNRGWGLRGAHAPLIFLKKMKSALFMVESTLFVYQIHRWHKNK